MIVYSHLGGDPHAESRIPVVCVAQYRLRCLRAVLFRYYLWSHVLEFDVLQVHSHENTEVKRPQVSVRFVLRYALLCRRVCTYGPYHDDVQYPLHII